MITKRAKRLEKYLREELDILTICPYWICTKCHTGSTSEGKYCRFCGSKMKKDKNIEKGDFEALEDAIAYALKEEDHE